MKNTVNNRIEGLYFVNLMLDPQSTNGLGQGMPLLLISMRGTYFSGKILHEKKKNF